jgi:carboxypeptidase C (cathepsin A)
VAQSARSPANPTANATASRRDTPDEPGSTGALVERRSERGQQAGEKKISDADIATAPVNEVAKTSRHNVTLGGRAIAYTATAGTLTIRDDDGKPIASMFYVAYVADRAKGEAERPVTFLYNGGPGSASLFVHMGMFGPMHVLTEAPNSVHTAPYAITQNPDSLLDKSDLVFLDAIGAGYSRPLGDTKGSAFWGVDQDIDAFARGIQRYVTINHRWNSPKFIFGESYGTTRSAGIAGYLNGRGIIFNGIGLLSMALNFQSLSTSPANDSAYPWLIPTYTAIAYFHHKLSPDLTKALDACQGNPNAPCAPLREAEEWAITDYSAALSRSDSMTDQQRAAVVDKLSHYTGLSKTVVDEFNLRIDVGTFDHYLLLDQRLRVGRLDGRYALPEPNFPGGRGPGGGGGGSDPASTATTGPFVMNFNNYMRTELNYKTDMPYYSSAQASGFFRWSSSGTTNAPGGPQGFQEEISPLRAAIVGNPWLKVLVMEGFYDLATPYFQAEYTMHELNLPAKYRANISYERYWSGHMVYLEQHAHAKLQKDWDGFIEKTSGE